MRWSIDFVADTLAAGRRFRILTMVDDFTRECLGLVVDTSLTGLRVARELDRIAELRGYPCMLVSDDGTELTSNAILAWQQEHAVEWHYIAPDKPMQNDSVESFRARPPKPDHAPSTNLLPFPSLECARGQCSKSETCGWLRSNVQVRG